MTQETTNEERLKALNEQKLQLEVAIYKVMGAIEILEALEKEEEESKNGKKKDSNTKKSSK